MLTQSDKEFMLMLESDYPDIYSRLASIYDTMKLDMKNGCHYIQNILTLLSGNFQLMELYNPSLTNDNRWSQLRQDLEHLNNVMIAVGGYRYAEVLNTKSVNVTDFADIVEDLAAELGMNAAVCTNLPFNKFINIDLEKISYVITVLFDNIIDVDPFAEVEISADCDDNYLNLHIIDHLKEFDPEVKASLFEPFNSGKQNHAGLSLANSYKILLSHNGQLSHSFAAPTGSDFLISIPLQV